MLNTLYKGFSILVIIRISSRIIDFFLKIFVIRAIDPQIYASTVHFQLITNIALFYSKTCLKNSYQKRVENLDQQKLYTSSTNLMLFGVPITMVIGIIMILAQCYLNDIKLKYFVACASLYGIAAVFEAIEEALITKLILQFKYDKVGQIEIISLIFKSLVLWIAVYFSLFYEYGVLIFGISQLTYSVILMFMSIKMAQSTKYALKKFKDQEVQVYIHKEMIKATKQFSVMSVIKLLLQQLQKIILVSYNISTLSSDYTIISNLGSVIPRYIFMPLQQIGFNIFSKSKDPKENKFTLEVLIKILVIFGILITVFGNCYSKNLLLLLLGSQWATKQIINALRVYCLYVLVMGINGISEAFVYAKISADKLKSFRIYMILTTIIYLIVSICFINAGLGAAGLFLGSCVSMIFRIFICWKTYIHKQIFAGFDSFWNLLLIFLPNKIIMGINLLSFILCWNIKDIFEYQIINLMIGGCVFLLNIAFILKFEKSILSNFKLLKQNKNK